MCFSKKTINKVFPRTSHQLVVFKAINKMKSFPRIYRNREFVDNLFILLFDCD